MADSSLPGETPITSPLEADQHGPEAPIGLSRKSIGFQLLYGGANSVIGIGNITFYTILLPARLTMLAPSNQTNTFTIIAGLGAIASILTNPLVGALSDRTTSVLGRRLPWLLAGMIFLLLSMLMLAYASSVLLLGVGSLLLQVGINILLAALSAILPDQVPLSQRGTVSAFGGMAPLVGGLIGQVIVIQAARGSSESFLILAQVSMLLLIIFCLVLREQRLPRASATPFQWKDIFTSLWLNPKKYPDFALVWGARCLVFLASTTFINYLYYFLQDRVRYTQLTGQPVTHGVQQIYIVYVLALLLASLVCGKLSDWLQLRKPFVIGASLCMAIGLFLLAFFPLWNLVIVGTIIVGSGFGTYLSVDLALASQLLPEAKNHGKDFGIMNMAIFLPMLVAPFLAAIALEWFHSYLVLFLLIAVGAILAALLIIPMKQVR